MGLNPIAWKYIVIGVMGLNPIASQSGIFLRKLLLTLLCGAARITFFRLQHSAGSQHVMPVALDAFCCLSLSDLQCCAHIL